MSLTVIPSSEIRALVVLPTTDLRADLPFFTKGLGFRLDQIYPADNPAVAILSGHGLRLRLDAHQSGPPGALTLQTDRDDMPGGTQVSPGGSIITTEPLNPPVFLPPTQHSFTVRRLADNAPWVVGRAGMQYRDLVPDRLGGAMIASHIRIPDGGPVPDMVHFHRVGFQLIFCVKGWVDVLYEDQGGLRRIAAGDCFIQPPEIRHRVMVASDGIEVIEIGVPADHVTEIDHDLILPTPDLRPDRAWQGQRFVHNLAVGAVWASHRLPGFIARDTTIAANTGGVAGVQVVRPDPVAPPQTGVWARHRTDILFAYVIAGRMTLEGRDKPPFALTAGDAFTIPPGDATRWSAASDDLELLEVALPGAIPTEIV